jgi:hypothetical protein
MTSMRESLSVDDETNKTNCSIRFRFKHVLDTLTFSLNFFEGFIL